MGNLGGDESRGAAHDVEYGGIVGAALLIDELVHGKTRVRLQGERSLVVEGDAERAVDVGLQHVAFVDRVAERKRAGGVVARDRGGALQRRDAADRIWRLRRSRRGGLGRCRRRRWSDRWSRRRRRL